MTKFRTLTAVLALACLSGSAAAGPVPAQPVLSEISASVADNRTQIEIRLDRAPAWSKVVGLQDHGAFLQLVLPGVVVPEPGRFYDIGGPGLTKAAVFQLTSSDAGLRMFVSGSATSVKNAMTTALDGGTIRLTLDHARLQEAPAVVTASEVGPPLPVELRPATPDAASAADAIIAATTVSKDIPAPGDLLKSGAGGSPAGAKPGLTGGGIDLRSKLIQVAVFCTVMLLMLVAAWVSRPWLRKRRLVGNGGGEPPVEMKTLASLPLAPRQKISLIQVGDEKLLVGITPDSVTFLKAIGQSRPALVPAFRGLGTATASFSDELTGDAGGQVALRPAPKLKNLPGNDPQTLRSRARPAAASPAKATAALTGARSDDSSGDQEHDDAEKNHDAAVTAAPTPAKAGASRVRGSKINVSVGEDGIKSHAPVSGARDQRTAPGAPAQKQQAVDDVTRLIREKLKNLRTIP